MDKEPAKTIHEGNVSAKSKVLQGLSKRRHNGHKLYDCYLGHFMVFPVSLLASWMVAFASYMLLNIGFSLMEPHFHWASIKPRLHLQTK